jgi:hypothetical protein
MQCYIRRGLAVALTAIGLNACADSLAPTEPRAARLPAAFSITGSADGTVICTPCPPGLICAAVCNPFPPIEVFPPVAGDSTGADSTIVFGPAQGLRTP